LSLILMRSYLSWMQPHSHRAILRHLLNTLNSFLCSSTKYFENRLIPNNLIIVRNRVDDEEDKQHINRVLERQGDVRIKVEIQSNSESQRLSSSPTRSTGPPRFKLIYRTHTKLDFDVLHMHRKRTI
jgi:hypothetical protein